MSGRRTGIRAYIAVATAVLFSAPAAVVIAPAASADGTGPAFTASPIIGGGFMSVVAQAADAGDYVYMAAGGAAPMFWEVQVTQCALTCPTATGFVDPYFHEAAGNAISLAAGSDGRVYLATQGNGMLVATAP